MGHPLSAQGTTRVASLPTQGSRAGLLWMLGLHQSLRSEFQKRKGCGHDNDKKTKSKYGHQDRKTHQPIPLGVGCSLGHRASEGQVNIREDLPL